jgi:hypothetical protein
MNRSLFLKSVLLFLLSMNLVIRLNASYSILVDDQKLDSQLCSTARKASAERAYGKTASHKTPQPVFSSNIMMVNWTKAGEPQVRSLSEIEFNKLRDVARSLPKADFDRLISENWSLSNSNLLSLLHSPKGKTPLRVAKLETDGYNK